jgi:hypothetical protein
MMIQELMTLHSAICLILGELSDASDRSNHQINTGATWVIETPNLNYADPSFVSLDYKSRKVEITLNGREISDHLKLFALVGYCAANDIPYAVDFV